MTTSQRVWFLFLATNYRGNCPVSQRLLKNPILNKAQGDDRGTEWDYSRNGVNICGIGNGTRVYVRGWTVSVAEL